MDSPGGLLNAIVSSEKDKYYDASGEVIYKSNPAIKNAFDLTAKAAKDGLVGAQTQFQPAWDTTIAKSKFAAIACPPWMLGYLKGKSAPESMRQVGRGRGAQVRQLGRHLPVRAQERQAREGGGEADHLADRSGAAGQAVQRAGQLPGSSAAYDLPLVTDAKNTMTGDAPIGKIFAEAAKAIPTQVIGPKDQIIQQGLTDNGVILVTKGKSAKEAWETATKTIDNNLEK